MKPKTLETLRKTFIYGGGGGSTITKPKKLQIPRTMFFLLSGEKHTYPSVG